MGDYDALKHLLEQVWGPLPAWLTVVFAVAVLGWAALKFLPELILKLDKARRAVRGLWDDVVRPEASRERRQFALGLLQQLEGINAQEDFVDDEFAELEAEVLVRGLASRRGSLRWLLGRRRKERVASLSKALMHCEPGLVLLEGDPGSGKSTAMRHLAIRLAQRSARAKGLGSVLPVYVNLREFRPADGKISHEGLRQFVLSALLGAERAQDAVPRVREYVEGQFEPNLSRGHWLFLFDSFDEAPAVLRSPNFGPLVRGLGKALEDFVRFTGCTAIVASRPYRSPNQFGWTHFQILPLSDARKIDLISRTPLSSDQQLHLREWLRTEASPGLVELSENPMFLSLVCKHWADHGSPRSSAFEVYDSYFASRFRREAARLSIRRQRNISEEQSRETAELVAYCLSVNRQLGLSCSRDQLENIVNDLDSPLPSFFRKGIDALLDIRVLREVGPSGSGVLRFEHRRFQEYFATAYLLRNPTSVEPSVLLTDPSWREAAVVLLQRKVGDSVLPLLVEACVILDEAFPHRRDADNYDECDPWPGASFHVLRLLRDGDGLSFVGVPERLREKVDDIILHAWESGRHDEKQSAIELIELVSPKRLLPWLREIFGPRGTDWLQETALRQFPRVHIESEYRQDCIQLMVGKLALSGQLADSRYLVYRLIDKLPARRKVAMRRLVSLLSHQRLYYALLFAAIWLWMLAYWSGQTGSWLSLTTLATVLTIVGAFWTLVDRLDLMSTSRDPRLYISADALRAARSFPTRTFCTVLVLLTFVFSFPFLFPNLQGSPERYAVAGVIFCFLATLPIFNLMFLPSDAIAVLITRNVYGLELASSGPVRLVWHLFMRFDPSEARKTWRESIRGWPGELLQVILYGAAVIAISGISIYLGFFGILAIGLVALLALFGVAAAVVLTLPLFRYAWTVWCRLSWLRKISNLPGSLTAVRFLELLGHCRTPTGATTLLDRVHATRCLEPNSDTVGLLVLLLQASDEMPRDSVKTQTQKLRRFFVECGKDQTCQAKPDKWTEDEPGVEKVARRFARERKDWLATLGPNFRDRLAQILVQAKAFIPNADEQRPSNKGMNAGPESK